MKYFSLSWCVCCMLLLSGCNKKDGSYTIELYANNDLHGRFFDSLYLGDQVNNYSLANISQYMKNKRAEKGPENILLVDVGDVLQGDNAAYYYNYIDTLKGVDDQSRHLFSRIAEYLQYDALVVGNHDIEAGHPVYDRIKKELPIPYLAANAIAVQSGKSYFQPYAIFNKNGIKIAVIGMTNPNIKHWLSEELWYGIDFLPIAEIADSLIQKIKKTEKPDVTILAIHAGLGTGRVDEIEDPARYLASTLQDVDIILAAHDHKTACEKIWNGKDSVLLMEGGARAKYLMNASIHLIFKDGQCVDKKITGDLIPMESVPVDKEYMAEFRNDFLLVKSFTNKEVGELPEDIYTRDAFFGPSDYMNLIHSIQLTGSGADISLAAPLTYNGHIKAGKLNYQDLFTIYPYENQLYTISLTGAQVKKYLEYSYDNWIKTMKKEDDHILNIYYNENTGRYSFKNMTFNFDSAAGIDYEVDVRQPFGKRIIIKSLSNGTPFNEETKYKVALSSYRANGGGNLLTEGVGLPVDSLSGIVLAKLPDIRNIIYDFYKNGNTGSVEVRPCWKFVPESMTIKALKRDKELLFGK